MRSIILGCLLALSIVLQVGTLTIAGLASVVSGAFESVFGVGTVLGIAGEGLSAAQARLATAEADLKTTKGDLDKATAKVTKLDAELTTSTKTNASLEADLGARDADLKTTKTRNTALLGEKAELSREVADLKAKKIVKYRGKPYFLQYAVSDTSSRISKRTVTGASRNLAATFGEAWPLAGTAVIVAATAMELHDACVIMQDLHELDVAFNPESAFAPEAQEVCGMKVPTKEELWERLRGSPAAAWENVRQAIPDLPPVDLSALHNLTSSLLGND